MLNFGAQTRCPYVERSEPPARDRTLKNSNLRLAGCMVCEGGSKISTIHACRCYSFLYDVFALEQYLAYQVYVYVIPETGFEHPVLYGTRNIDATGVTEPMLDGTLE